MNESRPVFLGCITHDGRIDMSSATALYVTASEKYPVLVQVQQSSLLAKNCNELWCDALNKRAKHNFKWFAMLHSDVRPEANWLDKLIELAEEHDADMLSVALPIKDERGLTSTAISSFFDKRSASVRLTQKQLKALPETFNWFDVMENFTTDQLKSPGSFLLANTGCMVVRLDKPFSEQLYFTISDRIEQLEGIFKAFVEPEDWFFSRRVQELGGLVMVTTAIKALHVGNMAYKNQGVWGNETDK